MPPLRLALPKGRLLEGVTRLLARLDIRFAGDERCYTPACSDPSIQAKIRKVRAIPQLLALGSYDAGFCGLDLVAESDYEDVVPVLDLRLNPVRLVVAVPADGTDFLEHPPRRPILIATEYERLADAWALRHNLAHITIQTWGSTEGYAPDDADVIFDCVETGRTMAANNLEIIDTILTSSTWLVASRQALDHPETGGAIRTLAARLEEHARH